MGEGMDVLYLDVLVRSELFDNGGLKIRTLRSWGRLPSCCGSRGELGI